MSLRTPRFKNEFLNIQNIYMTDKENLLFLTNQIDIIQESILNLLNNNELASYYTFGILDVDNNFYDLRDLAPTRFKSEAGSSATALTLQPKFFDLKYLLQEFNATREEDYLFLTKLLGAGLALNPRYQSYVERTKNYKQVALSPSSINSFLRQVSIYYDENKYVDEIVRNRFRLLPNQVATTKLNLSYNLYVGGSSVIYTDLTHFNKEYFYHFVYLYLYRLYDLTLNYEQTVNMCIVIPAINHLIDVENYKSFYVTEQQAEQRCYQIKALLKELLMRGREFNLNFILLDADEQVRELFGTYCTIIDTSIVGLNLDFQPNE